MIGELVSKSLKINANAPFEPIKVKYSSYEAEELFNSFEEESRVEVSAAKSVMNNSGAAIWNRANLKALTIASLLAVTDNCEEPEISIEQAR